MDILEKIENSYKLIQSNESPSLEELYNLYNQHSKRFEDIDCKVLLNYLDQSKESYCKGEYYLYGQLKIPIDKPITKDVIIESVRVNKQRMIDCPPAHQMDFFSVQRSQNYFDNFIMIIERYAQINLELKYAPGTGTEYLVAKERFDNNKIKK